MKKIIYKLFIAGLIILSVLTPEAVFAVTHQELFDGAGYTDGTDLNNLNGGTGFTAAWVTGGVGARWLAEATGCNTANCAVSGATAADAGANRDLATGGVTNGSLSFNVNRLDSDFNVILYMQKADDTTMFGAIFVRNGGTPNRGVNILNSGGSTNLPSSAVWASGTTYLYEAEFGSWNGICSANQVRARVTPNGGGWSSCLTYQNSATGAIEEIRLQTDETLGGNIIDDINIIDYDVATGTVGAAFDFTPYTVDMYNDPF